VKGMKSRQGITMIALVAAVVVAIAAAVPLGRAVAASPLRVPSCGTFEPNVEAFAGVMPVGRPDELPPPPISAKAAVVIDGDTGRVLYDLNAHERRAPASTTKIMTALLAIRDGGDLDRTVISDVDGSQMPDSSIMGLKPGFPISMRDLLYGLMLPSGNDAAIVLAEQVAGSTPAFVDLMNRTAAELGLRDTHFVNPHGLDDVHHYSSAYDLARLGRVAMQDPVFAQIAGTREWHLSPPWDYDLHNGNTLLGGYPGADGVKIGWTDWAGWTLVASAQRDGHRLFVTVLDSEDRNADASALFDWAFASYEWMPLSPRAITAARLARTLGLGDALARSIAMCG
jgi:D-alanyl-D-alanine carboxypeptidase (penicillin-binding protein 5/6)